MWFPIQIERVESKMLQLYRKQKRWYGWSSLATGRPSKRRLLRLVWVRIQSIRFVVIWKYEGIGVWNESFFWFRDMRKPKKNRTRNLYPLHERIMDYFFPEE